MTFETATVQVVNSRTAFLTINEKILSHSNLLINPNEREHAAKFS